MCYSVCAARPFMDQCIKACCFEYQTRLWLAPPAPLCWTDCTWSLRSPHTNSLPQKCLLPPPSSLRTTVVLFNSSPGRPLLAQHAACRGWLARQRSPRSPHAKFMTAAEYKRRAGASSVSQSRYRFSNPILLYPKTLFSCVTVAERVREEGERKKIKVFLSSTCLFSSCSAEYKSFFLITVRRGSRLPSTTGLSLVFLCTPEKALRSYVHWVQVEAGPILSGAMKAAFSARADYLR